MVISYIGLGSNLGNREKNISRAIELLQKRKGVEVKKVSSLCETKPAGGPPQGKFLNGVVAIETSLPPRELLKCLKEIEKAVGRKPSKVKWGPREIDLDILLYGDKKVDEPELKIPHPEMHRRGFVLKPLLEIAPQYGNRNKKANNAY